MKLKAVSIMMILSLLVSLFPFQAVGAESLTLTDILSKSPGDQVTLSGESSLTEVILKVIDPNQTLFYVDVTTPSAQGIYSQSFTLPAQAAVGTYTVQAGKGTLVVSKNFTVSSGGSDTGNPKPSITLSVTGDSQKGSILSKTTVELQANDTPYSVLKRTLGSQVESSGSDSSLYVTGISDLKEFDRGPASGWMYSVNCNFLSEGAGTRQLKNGDRVEWRYTLNLGKDLSCGSGPASSTSTPNLSSEVDQALKTVSILPSNHLPIDQQTGKMIAVINSNAKMTSQQMEQIRKLLQTNQINLSEKVNSNEEKLISDSQKEVSLTVPAQALTSATTITIKKGTMEDRKEIVSAIYEFGPNGTRFDKPVTISLKVPLDVSDLNPLALVWLDEQTQQWIPIPAVVDAKTGIITGLVDHFTKFAVIDRNKLTVQPRPELVHAMTKAVQSIQSKDSFSDWEAFALAKYGVPIPPGYLASVERTLTENKGTFRKVTDLQRMALGVLAAGGNPTSIAGYNLIEKIYNHERLTMQGTNGVIFALLALDSGNYETPANATWNREKLVSWLLQQKNATGGWPLAPGDESSVDITAMALSALSLYQQQEEVKKAIEKAVNWLSSIQLENGRYLEQKEENSESISQLIQGLAAVGIDPLDPKFVKAKGNLLTSLLSYQQVDGGFSHKAGQASNPIATEQALTALVAYDYYLKGKGSIYASNRPSDNHYLDEALISPWARHAVGKAREYKIMGGVSSTAPRFAPKELLTRAQFATLMSAIMKEKPTSPSKQIFADVIPNSWYDGYVTKAYEKGWMKGVSAARFEPNKPITRQEMAVIVANALKLDPQSSSAIRDLSQAKAYAQAAIQTVYENQLMIGHNGSFQPQAKVTREMAAVVAVQIFEKVNQAE